MKTISDVLYVREKLRFDVIPALQEEARGAVGDEAVKYAIKIGLMKERLSVIQWVLNEDSLESALEI